MSRDYRFVVRDTITRATSELTLVCNSDADALAVGTHLAGGHDLEVWDGARQVSLGPSRGPARLVEAPFDEPAQARDPRIAAPEPTEIELPAPVAPTPFDLEAERARPFNPFRPAAWRRFKRPA